MLSLNVVFLIGSALAEVTGGIVANFEVPVDLVYGPQPFLLQQANRHLLPTMVDVYVQNPSPFQEVLGLLAHGLANAIATLPMIVLARRLVDRAIDTNPF